MFIRFERTTAPIGFVQFSRNPGKGNYSRVRRYRQPIDYAGGGELYVYDKGDKEDERELRWPNISTQDYLNFMTFLDTVAVGAKNSFTFTDYDGATHTARIINAGDISSAPVMTGRESLTIRLRLEE